MRRIASIIGILIIFTLLLSASHGTPSTRGTWYIHKPIPFKPFTVDNKTLVIYSVMGQNGPLKNVTIKDNHTYSNNMTWVYENRTDDSGFAKCFYSEARNPTNLSVNGIEYHFNLPAPPTNGTTHIYYITLYSEGWYSILDAGYHNLRGYKLIFFKVMNKTKELNGTLEVEGHIIPIIKGNAVAIVSSSFSGNITINANNESIILNITGTKSVTSSLGTVYIDLSTLSTTAGAGTDIQKITIDRTTCLAGIIVVIAIAVILSIRRR